MPWNRRNRFELYHYNHLKQSSINGIRHEKMFLVHTSLFCTMLFQFWCSELIRYGIWVEGKVHSPSLYIWIFSETYILVSTRQVSDLQYCLTNHGHLIRNHWIRCAVNVLGFSRVYCYQLRHKNARQGGSNQNHQQQNCYKEYNWASRWIMKSKPQRRRGLDFSICLQSRWCAWQTWRVAPAIIPIMLRNSRFLSLWRVYR